MTLEEFYRKNGGSADKTVSRLGNSSMLVRFLQMLRQDDTFSVLTAALERGDGEEAFRMAHALKGIASNLGLDTLSDAASALTSELRDGDMSRGQALLPPVEHAYRQVLSGLETLEMQ